MRISTALAVFLGHGALSLQHLHHHRTGGHEAAEVVEERPRLVHGVEALGLLAAHVDALAGDDPEAGLLAAVDELDRDIAPGGTGLYAPAGYFDAHGLRLALDCSGWGLLGGCVFWLGAAAGGGRA